MVIVALSNSGSAVAPASQASFTLTAPASLSYAGVTSPGVRWSCAPSGGGVACRSGKPLPAQTVRVALVRFAVGTTAKPSLASVVAATATGVRARARVRIAAGAPVPSALVTVGGTTTVRAGQRAVETIDVLNVGSGPAKSVRLTNLLPASVVSSWSGRGSGWSCSGGACTNSTTIAVGKVAPRLTISYSLDTARVAALHLVTGGVPSTQQWAIGVAVPGAPSSTSNAAIAVAPPPGALLVPTLVVARGHAEVLPGTDTTIRATVANVGSAPTAGRVALFGEIPADTTIKQAIANGAAWNCNVTGVQFECSPNGTVVIAPRRSLRVDLTLAVSSAAKPSEGAVSVSAVSENQVASAKAKSASVPVAILQGNAGFPALTLQRATGTNALRPALDGGPVTLHATTPFTERLDVRDAGGAPILAGSQAELVQQFTPVVRISSVRAPAGWRCTSSSVLTCTLAFSRDLLPAATLEGPTVVLVDGTIGSRTWPATIHLVSGGAPRVSRMPVLVNVERGGVLLTPNIATVHVPTAGGTGSFTLGVRNKGDAPTADPVRVGIHLPAGVRLKSLDAKGWSCTAAPDARSARCTSPSTLAAGMRLTNIPLSLVFGPGTGGKTLTLSAHATDGARVAPKSAFASTEVIPRHAIQVHIKAPDKVVFADVPLVSAKEKLTPTVVSLEGDGSGGSGIGLHYLWTQRGGPPVRWLRQRAGTTQPASADVTFDAPQVTKPTMLVFDLTVTDGSATATGFVRVKVDPLASASSGFTIRNAHPKPERPAGPASVRRALPKPAEPLKRPAPTKKPAIVAAPTDTTTAATTTSAATTTTSATTTTGTTTTTVATTTTAGPPLPKLFCTIVTDALASRAFSVSLSGVTIHLKNVAVDGTTCSADTKVTFSGSSLSIHSFLDATDVAGSISKDAVTFSSGTLSGPAAWNAPTFSLKSGSGLTIGFGATDSTVSGSVEGAGFGFVPLPSGWSGTTTLDFADTASGASVSVHAEANGPRIDASPGSSPPGVTVDGTVDSDGTFSLEVNAQRVVQLAGHAINATGHVERTTPGGAISVSLEGSLAAPFAIVPGLTLQSLVVKLKPTDQSLGLTATGKIGLAVPSSSLDIAVKLAYDDPANWSLTAEGEGDATWQPVPGLTLAAKNFKGAIVAKDDKYALTLHVAADEWKPTSSITVSNLELNLSNMCKDTGAPCPRDASLFLDLHADASFELPVVGTLAASLDGALALPSGDFSVEASLPGSLDIGAGITIDNASVKIQHGMSMPSEEPSAESVDAGEFQVDLSGGVTLPGIGKVPTIHASFSSRGWAVAVPLGSFSLPGASGDGSQLGSAVLGWASYPTSMNVVDPTTKQPVKIALPASGFKITGTFATPGWLKQTLNLPGDIHGRATGTIDPEHDTYSLRMEFDVPGQPYLYGSASSASSIKLKSTYFEIARMGADFNLALGGSATLAIAGSASTSASSIDLGVALSYAVTSQTVAGTLTLSSQAGWRDAFGARDLTLFDLGVTFQLNLATLVPGVGFGARAVLPASARDALGVANGAQTTLVANLSITNPCLGILVDDPNKSGLDVLNIGKGALTAKQFEFEIAPTGCTVGQFHYDPGVSLNFNGTVAGVSLVVAAHVGFAPFALDASVDIGEFAIGGMTIQATHVDIGVKPNKVSIGFSGGIEVFGTTVKLSGSVKQSSTSMVADFTGTLDKLALGDTVTANGLAVTTHIETGTKNAASFTASGDITLLGSTLRGKFSLSLANGFLNAATADLTTVVNIGGPNGLGLDGTFKVDYAKTRPLSVDANVAVKAGGFNLATATVVVRPSYLTVAGDLAIGSVFTAHLEGAAYYGTPPAGSQITTPSGVANAQNGDFYVSASNVTLKLSGFTGTGSVTIGKAGTNPWAQLGGSLQLTGTSSNNSVSIAGSFETNGNFSLTGSAALNLAGFQPNVDVSVTKTGSDIAVSGSASVSFMGTDVKVKGDFSYAGGQYRFRLDGTATLGLGGYTLADSAIHFSNFPEDAGLWAQVNLNAGSTVHAGGRINVVLGGRFSFSADADINLVAFTVRGSVSFANYGDFCYPTFSWATFRFSTKCTTVDFAPRLAASATVGAGGFSFGVNMVVSSDGSFSATARTPVSGETVITSPTIDFGVVRGYAEIRYYMQLTVQSASPNIAVKGLGSAAIKYQTWFFGWSDWKDLIGASLEISTDPFHACGSATIIGVSVRGCIG